MTKFAKTLGLLLIFPLVAGQAGQFTWTGSTSSDLTDSGNWAPFGVPGSGDETDFDNTASNFTPTLDSSSISSSFTVDLVHIDNTSLSSGQYSFHISNNTEFDLSGSFLEPAGVMVTDRTRSGGVPVAPVQNFYIDNGGLMEFARNSIADVGYTTSDYQLPPFIIYTLGSSGLPGFMNFKNTSQAGAAGINLHNGSLVTFLDNSLGALAQINLDTNSTLDFSGLSSAGGCIVNATNSNVLFDTAANAFFSIFNLNNSPLTFSAAADVGSSTINATNGSNVVIGDVVLTGGRATILLTDSSLTYKVAADAGQSTIIADNSAVSFQNFSRLSSLATIQLANQSTLEFIDSADAGFSKIYADASTVIFGDYSSINPFPNSDNASVLLNNGSVLTMNNFANLLNITVMDSSSIINFNNFLTTPMLFSTPGSISNGHININPFGPSASGPVVFGNAFNSYPSMTVHRGTLIGNSLNIVGNIINNGTIVFNQLFTQAFFGNITGPGNVVLQGGGTLIVEGTHFIGTTAMEVINNSTVLEIEPSSLSAATLLIGDDALVNFEVPKGQMQSFNGLIIDVSGEHGAVAINKTDGRGTILLSNPGNSYTGGTTLYAGTLQIDNAVGVPGLLTVQDNAASVVFNQQVEGTYNGQLQGSGIGSKIGPAKLIFPANIQNELKTLNILEGELELNGFLTSTNIRVGSLATLSGGGTLKGGLEVFGTLSPRDGPLTFTVIGNVEFEPGSIYEVQVLDGNASLLAVKTLDDDDENAGEITIEENAAVEVTLVDGSYNPNQTYTILAADTSLTGKFSSSQISDPSLHAVITYDRRHAYLQIESPVSLLGSTFNQKQVAKQLARINTSNPLVNAFLIDLMQLPPEESQRALSQMSAEQYSQIFVTAQGVNQRFIHRLFDPLRTAISSNICLGNYCCQNEYEGMDCFDDVCFQNPWETWMDISFDRSYYKGNRNANGYKMNGYELSIGVQTALNSCMTLGAAASYEMDHLHFNVGGSGKNHTWLGGLYGLYRPQNYYVLADLILGYSSQNVKRPIDVPPFHLKAKGKPHLFQGATYFEAGLDYHVPWFIIQPFLALEVDYFHLRKIDEDEKSLLAVDVAQKFRTYANSRLGIHLTTHQREFSLAIDLAWQCRLTSLKNQFRERFDAFGDEFYIKGIPLHRNSLDGAINFSTSIACGWEMYAEAMGQVWERAAAYDFLLGIKGSF